MNDDQFQWLSREIEMTRIAAQKTASRVGFIVVVIIVGIVVQIFVGLAHG